MSGSGSTNTVDPLLGHTEGPSSEITDRDLVRARSSAYIVHGNFRDLAEMCDDIATTGLVKTSKEADNTDVENEVYRRVHNYVSSLYSYNEHIREILNRRLGQHIGKRYFLPGKDNRAAPDYTKRGAFLWGLRNDFQHGDYWCLSVEKANQDLDYAFYHLRFEKQDFNATPKGGIEDAGGYVAYAPDGEYEYPLPYIAHFHRNLFNDFESDFESWCDQ